MQSWHVAQATAHYNPMFFQNFSVNNRRGPGVYVLWGNTSMHGKIHPTTTTEIKLNGFTTIFFIANRNAPFPFNTKSYTSFIAMLYPQLLTGED